MLWNNLEELDGVQGGRKSQEAGIYVYLWLLWASLVAQLVKNPPAMQETLVRFLA